jgi:glycerol-3-phosphate acyltransferase PlsX
MRIGLDVMGGDFAPTATIAGAISAYKDLSSDDQIVLIGDQHIIRKEIEDEGADHNVFDIEHAPDVIGMGEQPTRAIVQKPNSSIAYGFSLLKNKEIDAFASAGNSGAMVVGAIYSVNTIQGIIRPCTSAIIPQTNGGTSILLDVGTIPDPKPDVMYQFGILGSLYTKYIFGIDSPRVALVNIGEEEEKGNLLSQSSFSLMKNSKDFNFVGNIEGRDLLKGKADVFVCDGFTGNVLLKNMESMYRMLVKRELTDDFIDRMNYENYGGTPLLGVNAPVIVGHGISKEQAIKNMILLARDVRSVRLSDKIAKALTQYTQAADLGDN